MLFDVMMDGSKIASKFVQPQDEQEPNEFRRCVSLHGHYSHTD